MLYAYPAYFYKVKNGGYSVIFPDLNHLSTCGDTLDKAFEMAIDCLAGYLYISLKDGDIIPIPSDINEINPINECDDENEIDYYNNGFINIVTVDVEEYAKTHFEKSIKKTLTIPKWLNDVAIEKRVNFSKILKNALLQELKIDN